MVVSAGIRMLSKVTFKNDRLLFKSVQMKYISIYLKEKDIRSVIDVYVSSIIIHVCSYMYKLTQLEV